MLLWALRRCCGLTLKEVGEAVGGLDYAAVAMALKRFETRASKDGKLAAARAKTGEMLNVKT